MKLDVRKKKIEKMRNQGKTYREIGEHFKITAERARQIDTHIVEFCNEHKRSFQEFCPYCKVDEEYVSKIKTIIREGVEDEIERLAKPSRRKDIVMQRIALIKELKNNFGLSFEQIGRLLHRNRSSIVNLYNK